MDCVILAGGFSSRMGANKALLPFRGRTLLEHQVDVLKQVFDGILISVREREPFERFGLELVVDNLPEGAPSGTTGALVGIYSALGACRSEHLFVVGCDMPLIRADVIRFLAGLVENYDVVIPLTQRGYEPLHAFYSKACLQPIENQLKRAELKIINFFPAVKVRAVSEDEVAEIDPHWASLANINTREDYRRLSSEALP